jgi:hypothetical protein
MSYFDHPELPSAPPEDTVIWRYLSLAEFLNILNQRTLHFTRVDRLSDSFLDIENQVALSALSGLHTGSTRRSFDLMKSVQSAVFANSWYENGSHAHLRWEIHGGNYEVAIRSTVKTLKKALAASSQKVYMSGVQYIDFASVPMPAGNVFLPALHKQHNLRNEREVRLLLLQTGGQTVFSPGPERGVDVSVENASLIKGIRVTPRSANWFQSLVASIADRYTLNLENSNSAASQPSPCRLRTANGCSCPTRTRSVESLRPINFA